MRAKLPQLTCCLLLLPLASCRGLEASHCSASNVVDTVKALEGGDNNPGLTALMTMSKATLSLDAIRTVSSSSNASVCEARLTIEFHMMRDGKLVVGIPLRNPNQLPGTAPSETAEVRGAREEMERQAGTKVMGITYKVETTDNGEGYVTIIPSDADVEQVQRQQLQQQQYEQNLENDEERDREYQDQLQQQRDQEWRERQEQEMQRRD